ncbi:MAG: hypothetical protein KKH97_07605 [Proteobacteria bacterium]|nr:hypothetical protein [Pseudomonadota bacterium]MBU1713474.1 hypothetical protein [Pseudomonadota bacterium]
MFTIEGHGHHWPGGKSALPVAMAGKNTGNLNAADIIWEFFKRHPRAGKIEVRQNAPAIAGKPCR